MNETNGKPELILKELRISHNETYDKNPGQYRALLKYVSQSSEHTLTLDESVSERVLAFIGPVIAEAAAMVARETQRNITRSLDALNNVKAIEAFAPPPAPDSPAMEAEMRIEVPREPGDVF